jgi:hypothetical protein
VPWETPDLQTPGITIRKGQLIVNASFISIQLLEPLVNELASQIQLKVRVPTRTPPATPGKIHVLLSGALSECPYMLRTLTQIIKDAYADTSMKDKVTVLPLVNGYVPHRSYST